MITTHSRMSDLETFCQEYAFTLREGMEEILMMFYEAAGPRDWIAFTLAGGAIQIYTSIMIPRTIAKENKH